MEDIKFEKIPSGIYDKVKNNREEFVEKFIDELEELFPDTVKDGKVDFEALLERFGEYQDNNERYELSWVGKNKARQESFEDLVGKTLKYIEEDSKNPDTTENLYIEGDNLEALKLLRNSYYGKIKMIYIDPPYNTGSDFVYKDDFTLSKEDYDELKGDLDDYGRRLVKNSSDSGRYHSDWLNMIYPRLQVAKDLLTDDGAIFISIDDHEVHNLRKICDEIFGEGNFIAKIIWEQGKNSASKLIDINHEYIFVYSKNKNNLIDIFDDGDIWRIRKDGIEEIYEQVDKLTYKYGNDYTMITNELRAYYSTKDKDSPVLNHKHYNNVDERGIYFAGDASAPDKPENRCHKPLIHPITKQESKVPRLGWRFKEDTLFELYEDNRFHFGKDETTIPCIKRYLFETEKEVMNSVFYKDARGASNRLDKLFDGKVFEFPKDEYIIKKLIKLSTIDDDIILDFFSGSATTAHAVMDLNAEDGGNRKFIMVQLPEPTDEKSAAYKEGYENICEIGKERIRRAGEKILEDNKDKEGIEDLDTGFKVFRVEDTNFRRIREVEDQDLESKYKSLSKKDREDFNSHFTDLDGVYELMLRRQDIELTEGIRQLEDIGDRTYIVGDTMLVCLEEDISEEMVEKIGDIDTDLSWIVLRDSAFDDKCDLKINTAKKLRSIIKSSRRKNQKIYWI